MGDDLPSRSGAATSAKVSADTPKAKSFGNTAMISRSTTVDDYSRYDPVNSESIP